MEFRTANSLATKTYNRQPEIQTSKQPDNRTPDNRQPDSQITGQTNCWTTLQRQKEKNTKRQTDKQTQRQKDKKRMV